MGCSGYTLSDSTWKKQGYFTPPNVKTKDSFEYGFSCSQKNDDGSSNTWSSSYEAIMQLTFEIKDAKDLQLVFGVQINRRNFDSSSYHQYLWSEVASGDIEASKDNYIDNTSSWNSQFSYYPSFTITSNDTTVTVQFKYKDSGNNLGGTFNVLWYDIQTSTGASVLNNGAKAAEAKVTLRDVAEELIERRVKKSLEEYIASQKETEETEEEKEEEKTDTEE